MSYIATQNGLPGVNWASPLEPSWSMYQHAWLRESMQQPRPICILTNNRITLASRETAMRTGIAGQATVPTFLTWRITDQEEQIDDMDQKPSRTKRDVDDLTDYIFGGKYSEIHQKGYKRKRSKLLEEFFPIEEILPDVLDPDVSIPSKADDIQKAIAAMLRTISAAIHPRQVYIPPDHHIQTWLDPKFRYFGMDQKSFNEYLDELQYQMFQRYQKNPPRGVDLHMAGYGILDKNKGEPKVQEDGFPGIRTKVSKRTSLKYLLNVRTTKYREERVMSLYTTLATMGYRDMLGHIEGFDTEDYCAGNQVIHSMFTGYGTPSFDNWLSGRDISETILQTFGSGVREIDPVRGISVEFYRDLFDWALMFGWQLARAVPMAEQIDVLLDSNELRAYEKLLFMHEHSVDLPGWGSKADPHFIMARNRLVAGEFALPCAVRSSRHKAGWKDYTNHVEWLDDIVFPDQKNMPVSGHTIDIPFEEFRTRSFYRFSFSSDAAMGRDVKGMNQRPVAYFRFPTMPLYTGDGRQNTPARRKYLWVLGLLTTGTQLLKDGLRVEPYYGAISGLNGRMKTYVDYMGEIRVVDEPKVLATPQSVQAINEDGSIGLPLPKPRELPESHNKVIAVEAVEESEQEPETSEEE